MGLRNTLQAKVSLKFQVRRIKAILLFCIGPLPETVVDFWHMIWQEKVSIIAMMTNTMERCTKKCEVYWPDVLNEEKEVGPFMIKLTAQQVFADYTVRDMELEVSII